MRRLLAATFVVTALLGATVTFDAPLAGACSCGVATDPEYFAQADAVFVGRLADYRGPDEPIVASTDAAYWTFDVSRVYKGEIEPTEVIVSEFSGASCGLEIPKQGEFLVFASDENGWPALGTDHLYAGLCGGTRASGKGLDHDGFGAGRAIGEAATPTPTARAAPVEDVVTSNTSSVAVVAIGLLLALGVGLAIDEAVRRRAA